MHRSSKQRRQKMARSPLSKTRRWKRALLIAACAASFATSSFLFAEESATVRRKLPTKSVMPAKLLLGVPDKRPVVVLNVAQVGLFAIENVSAFPSGSEALGWNAYAWSAVADVGGVPDMTGGLFAARDGAALTGQASPRIAATRDDPVPRRDA